ncbi:MAG: T9SS type A sorting domain-containing protein [Bacteroidetes bacterium]|nr:T9SS type A sorting domain-containing protein [Bacteroidota bacterium]
MPARTDTGRVVTHLFPSEGQFFVNAVVYMNGAIDTITRRLTIYPRPTVTAMGDTAICPSGSVRLECASSGREPLVYFWYPDDGLDDPYAPSPLASPDSSTMYRVVVTDLTGCVCEDSVYVEVRQELHTDGPDTVEVCKGQPVLLGFLVSGGMPPYRITWTSSTLADTVTASIEVTPVLDATYTCMVTDLTGCRTMDSIHVRVLDPPVLEMPDLYTICQGSSVQLEARITGGTGNSVISWKPEYGLSDPSTLKTIASPDSSTQYELSVTDENGCTTAKEAFVQVVPRIVPTISGDSLICEGSSGSLSVEADYQSYAWSTGDTTASIIVEKAGSYNVTVRDGNGCSGESMMDVRIVPRPLISIYGPDSIYPGEAIRIETDTGFPDYSWSTGGTGTFIDVTEPGRYLLSVTDRHGCAWIVEKIVSAAAQPMTVLFIPDITAAPGDTVAITIRMAESRNLEGLPRLAYTGIVSFERSVLYPLVDRYNDIGTVRQVEIAGEYRTADEVILTIPSLVTLGTVAESPITLTDFRWSPSFVASRNNTGHISVTICRESGDRLFDGTNTLVLAPNSPNPFNSSTRIRFSLIERGQTGLYILDLLGRRVATLVDAVLEPGYHELMFDGSSLSSGMYYYVLTTPNRSVVKIMSLLK